MKRILSPNFAFAVLIFISVYLLQCIYISLWGVNVPFWDQWDAEAKLYISFLDHSLDLESLIASHNEHRIAITRLWSLLVFSLRGGWDPKFGMYAQAIIQSVNASILFLLLNPTKKGLLYKTASLIAIVAVFGLPYYEENILWSFQNQFYWMQFFGILSFYLYTKRDTKLKFIAIAFVNFCTLFTVASGILSILVSISITFFFIFIKKKHSIHWKILFGFQFFLLFLGKLLWVSVSEHGMLKARDLSDLINAYLQILNWPNGIINLILYSSFLYYFLIHKRILSRINYIPNFYFGKYQFIILALLGWVLLQIFAVAYGRANGDVASSRYLITYSIAFPILIYFIANGLDKDFKKIKIISLLCSILVLFALGRYSYKTSLIDIKKDHADLIRWNESLKQAYLKDDMQILVKTKNKLHPRPKRIWKVIKDPVLKPYHLWKEGWDTVD